MADEDFEPFARRVHEAMRAKTQASITLTPTLALTLTLTLTLILTQAMRARERTQSSVCAQLSLSPIYFSIWLNQVI